MGGCPDDWEQMPQGTRVCGFKHAGKVGIGQTPLRGASLWDDMQDRVAEGRRLFISDWLEVGAWEPATKVPGIHFIITPSVLAQGGQERLWEHENEPLLPPRVVATLFITFVDSLQMSQTFVTHRRDR